MISPGFETTDPFTQTRFVVLQGARETVAEALGYRAVCERYLG